jgi:hypothetical protein
MPAASLLASSAENDFYFSSPEKSADFSGLLFHRKGPWRQPAFPNQNFCKLEILSRPICRLVFIYKL